MHHNTSKTYLFMKHSYILFFVFFILLGISCKKVQEEPQQVQEEEGVDELPESALNDLDTTQSFYIPLNKIKLPNGDNVEDFMQYVESIRNQRTLNDPYAGLSPWEAKNALIGDLLIHGDFLTNRTLHQYPYEGSNKPAQNGLAYIFGGKYWTYRTKASYSTNSAYAPCSEYLYGLDCSGFIYHLYKYAKLNFPEGPAAEQHKASTIQNALSAYPSLQIMTTVDLGKIQPIQFESGDIVYWSKLDGSSASHIGIVLRDFSGKMFVYQSNGSSYKNCQSNYGLGRGPRTVQLNSDYWFGSSANWKITRITVPNTSGCLFSWGCGILHASPGYGGSYPVEWTFYMQSYCNGVPPFQFMRVGENIWKDSNKFIITQPGKYTFKVRDQNGCIVSWVDEFE